MKNKEILLALLTKQAPLWGLVSVCQAEHIQKQISRKQAMKDPRWLTVRPVGTGAYHRPRVSSPIPRSLGNTLEWKERPNLYHPDGDISRS